MTVFLMFPGMFLFPNSYSPTTLGIAMIDMAMVSNGWHVQLGGVTYAGPQTLFNLVSYMRRAAIDVKMPTVMYDCIPQNGKIGHDKCDNPFFQAFSERYGSRYRLNIAWVRFMWYILAIFYGSAVLLSEWCVAYQPCRMKCTCRWQWQRRFCVQPKGTDEEVEALGEDTWDHVRLRSYAKALIIFFIPAFYDLWCSKTFVRYLNKVDEVFPEGQRMNARLGPLFLFFSWMNAAMAGVATILIYQR
ncbi:hypothetical protein CI238_10804 [Colletotrichum incanum]|uniref:Uncharacterized protein n=1 Tax=Colletotrichum incanum TaxID=1573173 RepID=A0A167BU33_COLIC|nr:hypothetical protein CI238_10804 [Colletotrichum incanum]